MRDEYTRYMERLTGAIVVLVLGACLFLTGMHIGMGQLIVKTQGQWFYLDIADGWVLLGSNLMAAFGMVLAVWGSMMAQEYVRAYHALSRHYTIGRTFVMVGLASTLLEAWRQEELG